MKRKGNYVTKLDRKNIDFLLNLRLIGWSYTSLSSFFGIDKKGIKYQCERYGIFHDGRGIQIPNLKEKETRWSYSDGEKINKGKSYSEYIKDLKKRSPSKMR